MKRYTFNIDLIIVVIMLFAVCIAGNVYQRHLHYELHKKNIELQINLTNTKIELINAKEKLNISAE